MEQLELARRQDYTGDYGSAGYNTGSASTDVFLGLIADPFQSQIQSTSFYAALGWSFGLGAGLFLLFCLLRPRISWIYAPRAKYADEKHAPPPVSDAFFGWWPTLKAVQEQQLVEKIGLDATIFLRYLKMTRNIFVVLSVLGCGILIPATLAGTHDSVPTGSGVYVFMRITPQYTYGQKFWAWVVLAYLFTGIIFFFLWSNYRAVTRLRKTYLQSADYCNSLHSRTLILRHIPQSSRTDDGIVQLMQSAKAVEDPPNAAVARNVKELPEMIDEHEEAVEELEAVLAKYLSNPNQLPARRPMMKPSKHDRSRSQQHQVDAIEYLTSRIARLEREINETRETVDRRSPLPYGFASYTHIEDAHAVAFASRKKGPQGTSVRLAPKPHDLIWQNLPLTRSRRRTQAFWNGCWMVILTILYIPPNVLTAVFLANLHNLGQVWSTFGANLAAHPVGWGIVQGIVAPAIQLAFFLFLPTFFRRLLVRSGDATKTSRERHVMSKLYAFKFFNQIFVFSIFASTWAFLATVIHSQERNAWDAIKEGGLGSKIAIGLCNISPFWITSQLSSYLGAAVDILQAWPLVYNFFARKFSHPTPRQLVELTAPQPFEYSSYYSQYLVILTVGLAFGTLQPLILPVTALYMTIEFWFKKYLLQYVLITKTESGGAFWRSVFNRYIFATLVMDAVIALLVGTKGIDSTMLYAMIPLIPALAGFKWYCAYAFDTEYTYYTTRGFSETETGTAAGPGTLPDGKKRRSAERVGVRFGNPALYKRLMTPMVHAKSQHLLQQVYRGRLDSEVEEHMPNSRPNSAFGFSDIYMSQMSASRPGKPTSGSPFEVVAESDLDFGNFKRRADFRDSFGGDGELYGRPEDHMSRPGTPSSMYSLGAASTLMGAGTAKHRSRSQSPATPARDTTQMNVGGIDGETTYPRGYAGLVDGGEESPARERSPFRRPRMPRLESVDIPDASLDRGEIADAGFDAYRDDESLYTYGARRTSQGSMGGMLQNAGGMGRSASPAGQRAMGRKPVPGNARVSRGRYEYIDGSSSGFGGETPQSGADDQQTNYDYFRRGGRG